MIADHFLRQQDRQVCASPCFPLHLPDFLPRAFKQDSSISYSRQPKLLVVFVPREDVSMTPGGTTRMRCVLSYSGGVVFCSDG